MRIPRRPSPPGTELAPGYIVMAHLNRGNRLDVYDAWSVERESRCVLKIVMPARASEARPARKLIREGRLLQRFSHPHLVRAYDVTCSVDGRPVIVLETLSGETLSHLIHRLDDDGQRLPFEDVAMLGIQLASALAYLHAKGWLHLDMKPSNIVAQGGRAMLIDLSVARRPGPAKAGVGTFEYLSPEQAKGGTLTAAADVWGLGAVLFAALIGEPPYGYDPTESEDGDELDDEWTYTYTEDGTGTAGEAGDEGDPNGDEDTTGEETATEDEEMSSTASADLVTDDAYPVLQGDPPAVLTRRDDVPDELAQLVDACLRRMPEERPTMLEVATRLDEWRASRVGQRYRP